MDNTSDESHHPDVDVQSRPEELYTRKQLSLEEIIASIMKVESGLMQARVSLAEQGNKEDSLEVLSTMIDELRSTCSHLDSAMKKNKGSSDISVIAERLAGWSSLAWIINALLQSIQTELDKLPKKSSTNIGVLLKKNIALTTVIPALKYFVQDCKTLNQILPIIVELTFGQANEKEIVDLLLTSYSAPFWYAFQAQTRTFRDVINLMKSTFASSHKETNILKKAFAAGSAAVKGVVSTASKQTQMSHELLRESASVELVRAMWNLPESGVGAFATKVSNPTITTSEKIFLAVPSKLEKKYGFDQIEVLVLCPKKLPFPTTLQFPLNWTGLRCKPPKNSDYHNGKHLIIHFHGGGFVASTPYSHEPYLRTWVNACGAMLLSCNYSKSPERQYPYPLNECYFMYKSAIDFFKPTKVVVCGDSAGGNLCLAVAVKAAMEGIRVPDGILASYPALDVSLSMTPSRVIFGHDIMLPSDILALALDSYLPANVDGRADPVASPLRATDEILKKLPDSSCFLSGALDPLLDDTSRFLARMRSLGKHPQWYLYDLPHGFLNFAAILPTAVTAIKQGAKYLEEFFKS